MDEKKSFGVKTKETAETAVLLYVGVQVFRGFAAMIHDTKSFFRARKANKEAE